MSDFIKATKLGGVFLIGRPAFSDERGFFKEIFRAGELEEKIGEPFIPLQASHSRSRRGVLRGVHIAPWAKLAYVPRGTVQQVIVDLRRDSPTFGKNISCVLGEENHLAVFIPPGCGNGYLVLSPFADYFYLTSDYWERGREQDLAWDDPDLAIPWQIKNPKVSSRDTRGISFSDLFPKAK